ncbi:hypothetical protein [Streptomyces sp. 142MFCol3.1]|uniref:hypothetical protein n=1 Tax=Streptomyces sp. 142MFCol3.1 TaxID=1172179 RepID=UPI00040568F5|nr:hypothetical protein [Streptomyces sp. 142MFCol3.1]
MQNIRSTTAGHILVAWIIALCALGAAGSLAAAVSTSAGSAGTAVVGPDEEDWH